MDSSQQLLDRCSLVLFLSGAHLFARTRKAKLVRCVLRVWFLCAIIPLIKAWIGFAEKGFGVAVMTYSTYICATITSNGVLMMRSKQLERFLEKLVKNINANDRKTILRKLSCVHGIYVAQIIILVIIIISSFHPFSDKSVLQIINNIYQAIGSCTTYWILSSCSFYWIALRIMSAHHKTLIKSLLQATFQKNCTYRMTEPMFLSIRQSSIEFERNLSFVPFLWFLYGVVGSSPLVYGLVRDPANALHVAYALLDYVPPMIVVVAVSRSMERCFESSEKVVRVVASNESIKSSDQSLILRELDSMKTIRLTGMSYFTLDRSFLMSYVGSVLTFAALMAGFSNK